MKSNKSVKDYYRLLYVTTKTNCDHLANVLEDIYDTHGLTVMVELSRAVIWARSSAVDPERQYSLVERLEIYKCRTRLEYLLYIHSTVYPGTGLT